MIAECPNSLLTPTVQAWSEEVLAHLERSQSRQPSKLPDALRQDLPMAFALSPYICDTCRRYPWLLAELIADGLYDAAASPGDATALQQRLDSWHRNRTQDAASGAAGAHDDEASRMASLRQFRHKWLVWILWRDMLALEGLDSTLVLLSTLADACVQMACDWAHASLQERFGQALDESGQAMQLLVLGMGKLGGHELNVSSDIDLIYLFRQSGQTNGPKSLDNAEYFRRVAVQLNRYLGEVTVDGFTYRVDTRLRPFGESGPLVMNLDGLEQYYLTQGRDWERYAMIKARVLSADETTATAFDALLLPFVYRRYLDYNAIDSIRQLKRKIAMSVKRKGLQNNIKLGVGGIREIEFIGQAFQLVRGGQQPQLRIRPIKQVLRTLVDMQLMPGHDADALCTAYDLLRRTENALQAMRDQQVHVLPENEEDQLRLVCLLGAKHWDSLSMAISEQRAQVSMRFDSLFSDWELNSDSATNQSADLEAEPASEAEIAWAVLSSPETSDEVMLECIAGLGLRASEELQQSLASVTRGGFYHRLTAEAQSRLDRVLPLLLDASLAQHDPDATLLRSLELVRQIAGRSGYLQILVERPHALTRLVNLFANSAWVATFVTQHPVVIDELLRESDHTDALDADVLYELAAAEVRRLAPLELDQQMDGLRRFQQTRTLRIVVAEQQEKLPVMSVSDQLTWLAEAIVAAVIELVQVPLLERHGRPSCIEDGQTVYPEVGVVAYGKLGGIELGYGSDLDLVFIHDSSGQRQQTDGDNPIDNNVFYARLAQKVVHFMNTLTPAGTLYEIDLRLRPNGQSGVLVIGIDAFEQYQRNEAWTWEHQALVRSRMITGSDSLKGKFDAIRKAVLATRRSRTELAAEVVSMRQKMRENLSNVNPGEIHLKQDSGCVADIEFMVQYLVLGYAANHAQLLEFTDNMRILDSVLECQLLSKEDCRVLQQHYLYLRSLLHRQSLQMRPPVVLLDEKIAHLTGQVTEIWQRLFNHDRPAGPD